MKKSIELIKKLIKEHEQSGFCTNYDEAESEKDPSKCFYMAYDVGRYETLCNLYNKLKRMEQ